LPDLIAYGRLDRFADGDAQAAGRVGILSRIRSPGLGFGAGAGHALPPQVFHHRLAIGLLIETHRTMNTLHVRPNCCAGKGQGAAPLAGAGFGGEPLDAEDLVVVGLGHGRVGLVAAGRADALVLVVDARRCAQRLFQGEGAQQRGRAPDLQARPAHLRDVDPALGADLLLDQVHGKDRRQHFRSHRVAVGAKRRVHFDVGKDVVPLPGHLAGGITFFERADAIHLEMGRQVVSPPMSLCRHVYGRNSHAVNRNQGLAHRPDRANQSAPAI
jgi:hypothetical protein